MNGIQNFCSSSRFGLWFAALGTTLVVGAAAAQTTNIADLRELRVACLESFNTAQTRLEDLHAFVDRQASCERASANEVFRLKQNAAGDKRRNAELQSQATNDLTRLEQAKLAVGHAATSYRASLESLPNGEIWAAEGATALNELRHNADASPRESWKHKRVKEVEEEFVSTLSQWRAARRSIEQANFDLELRAAPSVYKRIGDQIDSVSVELKSLATQLEKHEVTLADQAKESARWDTAIRALCDGEVKSRRQLADTAFKFHLVDLKFAAWRLKASGDKDLGLEALPDVFEKAVQNETAPEPTSAPHPNVEAVNIAGHTLRGGHDENRVMEDKATAPEPVEPAFTEILARVNLAQARLSFISEAWGTEVAGVSNAISEVENLEEQVRLFSDSTAGLASDIELLRRSLETEHRALSTGAETLDLVQKRFTTDLDVINHLLELAADRTEKLAKGLEK